MNFYGLTFTAEEDGDRKAVGGDSGERAGSGSPVCVSLEASGFFRYLSSFERWIGYFFVCNFLGIDSVINM